MCIAGYSIKFSFKLHIARATAFAVATYGCELWAYSKKVTKKIEAFEMWTYQRLLRVSWRQHKTNAWILEQLLKNEANASETNEEKEDETFWSHHQTQQPGKDYHPRDHCREERQRETSKNLGERHRGMGEDKHWWSNQNGREEGSVVHCHRRHSSSTLSHLNRERERGPLGHLWQILVKVTIDPNNCPRLLFPNGTFSSCYVFVLFTIEARGSWCAWLKKD